MSSALNNNLLSNTGRVYPGAIDNASFDASKYGSTALEVSNNYYGRGGKKSRKNKTRKTYKRGRVGKGKKVSRKTRGRKC